MKAMNVGVTGMAAQQEALNVISNNIANSQTTGYKGQRTEFEELFYQQYKAPVGVRDKVAGINPIEIGNGVKVGATTTNHDQGGVKYTGRKTDVAIEGNGMFVLGDRTGSVTDRYYTRDGSFKLSPENELVATDGKFVMGWNVDQFTGKINTGAIVDPIKLDIGTVFQPKTTTEIALKGNLDLGAKNGDRTGIQVASYDTIGHRHDINFDFVKTGNNTYKYISTVDDQHFRPDTSGQGVTKAILNPSPSIAGSIASGAYTLNSSIITSGPNAGRVNISVNGPGGISFNQVVSNINQTITLSDPSRADGGDMFSIDFKAVSGTVTRSSTFNVAAAGNLSFDSKGNVLPPADTTISYNPGGGAQQVNIDVDFSKFTGLSVDSDLKVDKQNGYGAAVLEDFSIQAGGMISGYFSDGTMREIAQIALATFDNPEGLSRVGSSQFVETPNSGLAQVGTSGTGIRGAIKGETLETSNVDLAQEFVDMMVTQKAFTGNTKVIQTADTILNSVISLIR